MKGREMDVETKLTVCGRGQGVLRMHSMRLNVKVVDGVLASRTRELLSAQVTVMQKRLSEHLNEAQVVICDINDVPMRVRFGQSPHEIINDWLACLN